MRLVKYLYANVANQKGGSGQLTHTKTKVSSQGWEAASQQ